MAKQRGGYVFLLMVLFISIIAFTVLGSYLVLSVTALQSSRSVELSAQSLANASACAEYALQSLLEDIQYNGDETRTLQTGTCDILEVEGSGSEDRTICTVGTVENSSRKLEIDVAEVLPTISISSWKEVSDFTSCSL